MKDRWISLMLTGLAFVVLMSPVPQATAATPQEERKAEAVTLHNTDPAATAAFWEAMGEAPAAPMPLAEKTGTPFAPESFTPPGTPGAVPAVLPAEFEALAVEEPPAAATTSEPIFGGAQWYPYPPPHTRYFPTYGNNFFPHMTLGKLFFSIGSSGFVCSAAAVTCSQQDLVMTAGHCCAAGDGATWYQNFLFVPACVGANCNVGGSAPFGRWNWESVTVPTAWFNTGDLARDVCFLKVQPNVLGQQIQNVTGALGFAWNQPQPLHYHQTGWPAASPFNGARLVLEVGSTADLDGSESPNTIGVGNFMTGGSSGGAWIWEYREGNVTTGDYWNGLNSYKYTSPARPDEMYGPYIDTTIQNVRLQVCP